MSDSDTSLQKQRSGQHCCLKTSFLYTYIHLAAWPKIVKITRNEEKCWEKEYSLILGPKVKVDFKILTFGIGGPIPKVPHVIVAATSHNV